MKAVNNNKILFIIFLTVFLNMLGIGIIIPVIAPMLLDVSNPLLPADFPFAHRTILLGFLVGSFPLAQFFGSPILGSLSDRHGRKKTLLIALAGTFSGYILVIIGILTHSIPLLFLGRILDGITGGNVSIIYSSIADISDSEAKTKNFGLVGTAFGLGFIVGPFTGGMLSDPEIVSWFDYWTPFLLAAVLILLNILMVIQYLPETLNVRSTKKENLLTIGVMNIGKAFQSANTKYLLIVIFMTTFGFTFFTQFFQVYLIEKFEYRQSDIGKLFGYIGIWIALSQGVITRYLSKYISSHFILYFSLPALSLVFLMLLLPESSIWLYFILPFVSISQGINQPNMLAVMSNISEEDKQGEMLGVNQSLQSLAFAFPPIIAGFAVSFNINFPLLFASICVMISWIIYSVTTPYKPSVAREDSRFTRPWT